MPSRPNPIGVDADDPGPKASNNVWGNYRSGSSGSASPPSFYGHHSRSEATPGYTRKSDEEVSRLLGKILRYRLAEYGLTPDPEGYVDLADLSRVLKHDQAEVKRIAQASRGGQGPRFDVKDGGGRTRLKATYRHQDVPTKQGPSQGFPRRDVPSFQETSLPEKEVVAPPMSPASFHVNASPSQSMDEQDYLARRSDATRSASSPDNSTNACRSSSSTAPAPSLSTPMEPKIAAANPLAQLGDGRNLRNSAPRNPEGGNRAAASQPLGGGQGAAPMYASQALKADEKQHNTGPGGSSRFATSDLRGPEQSGRQASSMEDRPESYVSRAGAVPGAGENYEKQQFVEEVWYCYKDKSGKTYTIKEEDQKEWFYLESPPQGWKMYKDAKGCKWWLNEKSGRFFYETLAPSS